MKDKGAFRDVSFAELQDRINTLEEEAKHLENEAKYTNKHLGVLHECLADTSKSFRWVWIFIALSVVFQLLSAASQILAWVYGE